jgi:hypothetical protein
MEATGLAVKHLLSAAPAEATYPMKTHAVDTRRAK